MPNLTPYLKALRNVFKSGVESVSKEELEYLFSKAPNKLYRQDFSPKVLLRRGFKPETNFEDTPGLYWSPSLRGHREYGKGRYGLSSKQQDRLTMIGIPDPDSTWSKMSHVQARKIQDEQDLLFNLLVEGGLSEKQATREVSGNPFTTDFLRRTWPGGWDEVIQLNKEKVLTKFKDLYKILGLTAALGGSLNPERER